MAEKQQARKGEPRVNCAAWRAFYRPASPARARWPLQCAVLARASALTRRLDASREKLADIDRGVIVDVPEAATIFNYPGHELKQ